MVNVVKQLCIKGWEITAENGDYWKAEQGKTYTTTVPDEKPYVTVFSRYWVKAPKENFVLCEKQTKPGSNLGSAG